MAELRRLLLAEDAMLNVSAWARFYGERESVPTDRRARTVAAAGVVAMFWRPFVNDDKGERLEPDEWRERIVDDAGHAEMFDRLRIRRNKVFAHADTGAGVVNVTNTYRMFQRREPEDPFDLRVYDVGADGGLLERESLALIAELADRLAGLFSERMIELGAVRVRELA
ncbi:MAG: hypothetical protein AABM30_09355 [Actinomycetota bacterium]